MVTRALYKRAVHVVSGVLIWSNACMIGLGVAAMLVTLDPWLDVLVENVIIGATSI
ncbi:MAG: hypothetical protein GYA24_25190, partial [Candidatus Lokiarchaeota archaeon]|nr:hypothetical protein [Candidatus Lokiarchaeota archaeon]